MQVPTTLSLAFQKEFEDSIGSFAIEQKLLGFDESLASERFLARSVVPHVKKLSFLFNRMDDQDLGKQDLSREVGGSDEAAEKSKTSKTGLDPYWKESSNSRHLRMAYFLYFMPANLFRVAAVWSELARFGFRWPEGLPFKGIEFGSGPAAGACGIAAGERYSPLGLPEGGNWALIEQNKSMLKLGSEWANHYFSELGFKDWPIRTFHRKISLGKISLEGGSHRDGDAESFLPRTAPKFSLWVMSYFLNELNQNPEIIARKLIQTLEHHLEEEGLVILVEPALKQQSRKLLEIRQEILKNPGQLQVLLPCLGHQACDALADEEDWCHEEVSWWRPPYYRVIDKLAGLDRKTLPFSYLVLSRSARPRAELLPKLGNALSQCRIVSPAHREGKDWEFYICGQEGKKRARCQLENLGRGTVLLDATVRGDKNSSRVETVKSII